MKKDNKKALYESIMMAVAKEVKKALNEDTTENEDSDNIFIDLNLPSGTLWCKYNLDVNQKQLSKPEDWYGGYYAWGEIDNKNNYTQNNYKFGDLNHLTKYNKKDKLTKLLPDDDVAYQTNREWHIPTKEQCEELLNLRHGFVTNYNDIDGLNGIIFIGKNNNKLFIPAGGYYTTMLYGENTDACIWSCNGNDAYACYLYGNKDSIGLHNYKRNLGFNIRPVIRN